MKPLRVFVDTGAWFAIQIRDDEWHTAAARTLRQLLAGPHTLVTTNHVIGETYTLLRSSRGILAAMRFLEILPKSTRVQRIFVADEMEGRAFTLLRRYRDHDFSFVDATSFVTMRTQRIRCAFAFDRHFATAGFARIPQDLPAEQV